MVVVVSSAAAVEILNGLREVNGDRGTSREYKCFDKKESQERDREVSGDHFWNRMISGRQRPQP